MLTYISNYASTGHYICLSDSQDLYLLLSHHICLSAIISVSQPLYLTLIHYNCLSASQSLYLSFSSSAIASASQRLSHHSCLSAIIAASQPHEHGSRFPAVASFGGLWFGVSMTRRGAWMVPFWSACGRHWSSILKSLLCSRSPRCHVQPGPDFILEPAPPPKSHHCRILTKEMSQAVISPLPPLIWPDLLLSFGWEGEELGERGGNCKNLISELKVEGRCD